MVGGPPDCLEVVVRLYRMSGSGRKAIPNVREWSGDSLGCPGVVGWPSQLPRSGLEILSDVREWSGGPPRCPGVVERPTKSPGMVGRQSRKSGKGRETLLEVCEGLKGPPKTWKGQMAHPEVRESSGYTPGSLGRVGRLSQKSWSSRETLSHVWKWYGGPPGCPGVVLGRPARMSRSGRDILLDVWEWSRGTPKYREWSGYSPGCLVVVRRPSRKSGRDQEALSEVEEGSGDPSKSPGEVGSPPPDVR